MARHGSGTPTPKDVGVEGRTTTGLQPAAKTAIPEMAPTTAMAAWVPRQPEMGDEMATIPKTSLGLEVPGFAQERPSCGGHSRTSLVLARGREKRQPRGVKPRGTLRGGPERSAGDPRRNPRGGLCGGPKRSAKEPQTPSQKTSCHDTNGRKTGKGDQRSRKDP